MADVVVVIQLRIPRLDLLRVKIATSLSFFFFSSRRRHTRFDCDWSSDVCSSDLYKKSRRENAEIDRAVVHVLSHQTESAEFLEFSPYGYDERQYCSPGFNLPVGGLMRSVWGTFPEYHTSADNLEFIHPAQLAESLRVCAAVFDVLESNRDRKSTRLNSSHSQISYAVFCLKKKKKQSSEQHDALH